MIDGKPGGLSTVIGARAASIAQSGEVLVSGTRRELVAGTDFTFEERGEHDLKGVPGPWWLFAVTDG